MDRGLKAARSDFRPAIRAGGRGQLGRKGLADVGGISEGESVNVNVLVCCDF